MNTLVLIIVIGVCMCLWKKIKRHYYSAVAYIDKIKKAMIACEFLNENEMDIMELKNVLSSLCSRENEVKKQYENIQQIKSIIDDRGGIDTELDMEEVQCIERIDVGIKDERTIVGYRKSESDMEGWKEWFLYIDRAAHNKLCAEFKAYKNT